MKKLLVIALAIGALASCKKSDDTPAQLEVTLANVAGVYKLTGSVEVIGGVSYDRYNGGTTSAGLSYTSDYQNCEKDDTFTFTATGTVSTAEGATSCTPPTSSLTSSYTVQTSTKTISIPLLGLGGTIESLTSAQMVLKETSASGGVTTVHTYTFSR